MVDKKVPFVKLCSVFPYCHLNSTLDHSQVLLGPWIVRLTLKLGVSIKRDQIHLKLLHHM